MGSSAKKKAEKKKDFQVLFSHMLWLSECHLLTSYQKPKYKVGKAKPKASNFTDTSFRSKGMTTLMLLHKAKAVTNSHQRLL